MTTEAHSIPGPKEIDFVQYVSDWIQEAKSELIQMGLNVKNMTHEANQLVAAMAQSRETLQQLVANSKTSQEPIEKQLESALNAYTDVARASQELSRHLTLTTESVMKEAKLMQTLKNRVNILQGN